MKRLVIFSILFFCSATAFPQNSNPALDYGTLIPMERTFETTLDRGYLNDPDVVAVNYQKVMDITFLLWSPDGKRLYFGDYRNIFSVSLAGGTPRLEFESIYIKSYNGKRYVLTPSIQGLVGFSSDGNKLFFNIEEWSDAKIETTDGDGWYGGATEVIWCLKSLDLLTGEIQTVISNAMAETMSRSGQYVGYFDDEANSRMVMDLATGETWSNGTPLDASFCFSSDEQYILYSPYGTPAQFFRIPIRGGEPQLLFTSSGYYGHPNPMECAPHGDFVIASCWTGEYSSNTTDLFSYTNKPVTECALFDINRGTTSVLLPFSKSIDANCVRFSPDGKQFCYIFKNYDSYDNYKIGNTLYIQDISLPNGEPDKQLSVTDAAPQGFTLTGNYPNPFNPTTRISFTLPSPGAMRMSVYDVTGRMVRNLVSSTLAAGAHEIVWDGRDNTGIAVSSGTYIARLKMGNHTASHRMMLMK